MADAMATNHRPPTPRPVQRPKLLIDSLSSEDDDSDSSFDDDFDFYDDNRLPTESDEEIEFIHLPRERRPEVLPFPANPEVIRECWICFETKNLRLRMCCSFPVCDECVTEYLKTQVNQGVVKIECLDAKCSSYVHRDEVLARLPGELKEKFYKFLIDANKDPNVKTCPRCSHVRTLTKEENSLSRKKMKKGLLVICSKCSLEWCFLCHAPWHSDVTCKEYRKGDKLVKNWSQEYHYGQLNAQKCPRCKVFIQRTTGCDQMTCTRCHTIFCYRCGEQFWGTALLGNHFSRLSPFGCKYNFMPDRPGTRRLIRGAVLSGQLMAGAVLGSLALAVGALLLGVSVVILPAYGGYRLHKKRRRRKRARTLHARFRAMQMPNQHIRPEESQTRIADLRATEIQNSEDLDLEEGFTFIGLVRDAEDVEVLVHQAINATDPTTSSLPSEERTVDSTRVTVTEWKEVINEAGYKTVVAHVVSHPVEESKEQLDQGEENNSSGSRENPRSSDELSSVETPSINSNVVGGNNSKTIDTQLKQTSSQVRDDRREVGDSESDRDSKDINGCFVHIIAKKINSLQNPSIGDSGGIKGQGNQKGSLKRKSATWEKSAKKKESRHQGNMSVKSVSAILASECPEKENRDAQNGLENPKALGSHQGSLDSDDATGVISDLESEEAQRAESCSNLANTQSNEGVEECFCSPCDMVTYL